MHAIVTEQILQDEPSVRTAFADAAVGNDFVFPAYAFGSVKLLQLICALEGAVFVGGLRPRHTRGSGNLAAPLGGFAHARGRDPLRNEFVDRSLVDHVAAITVFHYRERGYLPRAQL